MKKRFKVNDKGIKVNDEDNKVNDKDNKICSKLTIKASKLMIKTTIRRQWRRPGVYIVKFKHISRLFLVLLFLILNRSVFTWAILLSEFISPTEAVFFSYQKANEIVEIYIRSKSIVAATKLRS